MNRFQIFNCKCYIFSFAMELFLGDLANYALLSMPIISMAWNMCGVCAEYTTIKMSMSTLKTLSKQSFDIFFVNSIPCNTIHIEH